MMLLVVSGACVICYEVECAITIFVFIINMMFFDDLYYGYLELIFKLNLTT